MGKGRIVAGAVVAMLGTVGGAQATAPERRSMRPISTSLERPEAGASMLREAGSSQ
jgi:hypothetical protein